jgi:hypothetical protein
VGRLRIRAVVKSLLRRRADKQAMSEAGFWYNLNCTCRGDLKRFMIRSRRRVGRWEFSARLLRQLVAGFDAGQQTLL